MSTHVFACCICACMVALRKATKGNLLKDESIKKTFDEFVEKQGKEAGETYIKGLIEAGNKINDDLIVANQVFNKTAQLRTSRRRNPVIAKLMRMFIIFIDILRFYTLTELTLNGRSKKPENAKCER